MPASRAGERRHCPARAFTLIELVVVMVLLAIAAALVAPHMAAFFHGRVLNSEARRLLALSRYGQSRAVATGDPVLLWIDGPKGTYGLTTQSSATGTDDPATTFTVDPSLKLQAFAPDPATTSETGEENFGVPDGLPVIRFMPDGFFDESSVSRIVIRQADTGEALELVPAANRLGYEIQPDKTNS